MVSLTQIPLFMLVPYFQSNASKAPIISVDVETILSVYQAEVGGY